MLQPVLRHIARISFVVSLAHRDLSGHRTCLLVIAPPPIAGAPANSVLLFIETLYAVTLEQASRTCAMLALLSSADRLFPDRSLWASLSA